jgi:putative pre-16S rRNA nuclease
VRILAIDWGERKIGLAMADGLLAEPLVVVKSKEAILKILDRYNIQKVIVGISEGESAIKAKAFSLALASSLTIPVETSDETLSTHEAQRLAIEAGISIKKRKGMEDAFAAAIMLQNYLDSNRIDQ